MFKELGHRDRGGTNDGGIRGKLGQADGGRLVEFGNDAFIDHFARGFEQRLTTFGDDIAQDDSLRVERVEDGHATVADIPADVMDELLRRLVALGGLLEQCVACLLVGHAARRFRRAARG